MNNKSWRENFTENCKVFWTNDKSKEEIELRQDKALGDIVKEISDIQDIVEFPKFIVTTVAAQNIKL